MFWPVFFIMIANNSDHKLNNNKTLSKTKQSISYPTFWSSKFNAAVLVVFFGTLQLTFVNMLSAAIIYLSYVITESSVIPPAYPPFLQLYVTGFQI